MGEKCCRLLAPAKINLCLHVQGKLDNGYHELVMLMQRVSLFDEIELTLTGDGGLELESPDLGPPEDNLAFRAARILLDHVGTSLGVRIALRKHIPVAAGLGGGSSDAATVLLGLNRVAELGLGRECLMRLGVRLGADVPFFILEQSAWATGIGDTLEPVSDLPGLHYVLVNPNIPVSTAWVYQNLGLTTPVDLAKLRKFPRTAEGLVRLLNNDLEPVTSRRHPEIAIMHRHLVEQGAAGSLMSGSGATVFGIFEEKRLADHAADVIASRTGWWTSSVAPLP